MSQTSDINVAANPTGLAMRTELNSILEALASLNSGSARPAYLTSGPWIDTSGGVTAWLLKVFDGTDDITIGTINTTANTFVPAGTDKVLANNVADKTATFTVQTTERGTVYACNAASGSITANLPSGVSDGFAVIIQKTDSGTNSIIIDPNGSETINGASTSVINAQYDGVLVVKNDSNWIAIPFGSSAKLKISAGDTTSNYLENKITASSGVSIAKQNAGSNESLLLTLLLASSGGLEIVSNALKVKTNVGCFLDANGLNVDVGTTANKIVQLNGSAYLPALDGRNLFNLSINNMQVFYASGTWTRPQGVTKCYVTVIGAGGSGSDPIGDGYTNGGGAAYIEGMVDLAVVGNPSTVTVTVGQAAAIGTNTAGGSSSFGTSLTAPGGRADATTTRIAPTYDYSHTAIKAASKGVSTQVTAANRSDTDIINTASPGSNPNPNGYGCGALGNLIGGGTLKYPPVNGIVIVSW